MRHYWVYILASRTRRLYVGVTGNLPARLQQHRDGQVQFTAKYRIVRLVYAERAERPIEAIAREKQLKGWRRARKLALISAANPAWAELPVTA